MKVLFAIPRMLQRFHGRSMNRYLVIACAAILSATVFANSQKEVSKEHLYNHFFSITGTKDCKAHTPCRMLRRHLIRDTKNCQMDPLAVEVVDQNFEAHEDRQLKVKGSMRYLGVFPGKYAYHTYMDDGYIVINARMYFSNHKDFPAKGLAAMEEKFKMASKIWSENNPYPFPVKFVFELTRDPKKAHIKAKLLKKRTRGPYFRRWSLSWSATTIAHEFGHVMGMDDEYANGLSGGNTDDCDRESIMCASGTGRPQIYHYYLAYRRLLCHKLKSL